MEKHGLLRGDAQFRSPKPMTLEKEGLPFQILVEWMHLPPFFVVWSFFQSIFPQLFLLLRGKDKKRSLLKGFRYGFWSCVWPSCPIAFCGNRCSSFAPIRCLENPLHFSFQPRSSIASTSSSRNIHYSLSSFLGVEMMPLLRYTLVLWPLSTLTPFSWEKKVMRFNRAPQKGEKKNPYSSETIWA